MHRLLTLMVFVVAPSLLAVPESSAQNLVPCAREGEFCRVPYETEVIYGARGRTAEREVGPPGVLCSNRTFGDPMPGVQKGCAFVARRGRRGYDGFDGPSRRWDDSHYGRRDPYSEQDYRRRDRFEGQERRRWENY